MRVIDEMFFVAVQALAQQVTDQDHKLGRVFPALSRLRDLSVHIAAAVAEVAYARGLTSTAKPADLVAHLRSLMHEPAYPPYLADH